MTQDVTAVKIANHYKDALKLREEGHNADTIIQACIRWANEEKIEWTKIKEMAQTVSKEAIDPDIQFVLSGEGVCYCTDSLICSPCGKD